ncbi:hypothetical protein CSKR_104611 [Clonorchis sinensis]|uniref:Uncharacterized protein n=1 Tax=Clonorchis sinensis TaxID=79923 RepID=A0A3R7GC18_CLOSI|nr:hypothetical protein CSKR_104611 [Clonorchis sinensis]
MENTNTSNSDSRQKDSDNKARPEATTAAIRFRSVRQAIVARLHELEAENKRLTREKTSLEHQLLHVLERLGTGEYSGGEGRVSAMDREEVRMLISTTIDKLDAKITKPDWIGTTDVAPLAEPDYSGLRGSLAESAIPSAFEYSSLSDAYEEICLQKDLVQKMITSESSSPSRDLQTKPDRDHISGPVPSSSKTSPQAPFAMTQTIQTMKSSGDLATLSTSSRVADQYVFNIDDKSKDESQSCVGAKQRVKGEVDFASPISIRPSTFHRVDAKIKVPQWLTQMHEGSNLDVLNAALRKDGYDSESTQTSLGSCSIFSSSSSSSSGSPTRSPVPTKPALGANKHNFSSMPSSPVGPTSRAGRYRELCVGEAARGLDDRKKQEPPLQRRRTSSSFHTLRAEYTKPKSREELITIMRRMYGLPTDRKGDELMGDVTQRECAIPVGGPPKVKISRRRMKQPTHVEEYSDTTSTNSQNVQPEIRGLPIHRYATSQRGMDFDRSTLFTRQQVKPVPHGIQSAETARRQEFRKISPKHYTPVYDTRKLQVSNGQPVRIGSSSDFLRSPMQFGQFFPTDRQVLFESRDFPILTCLMRPIVGLDAFTRTQGQLSLFQRIQPPFPSPTPILNSHGVANHSHESSDLTSELSTQAHPARLPHKKFTKIEKLEIADGLETKSTTETAIAKSRLGEASLIEAVHAPESQIVCSNGNVSSFEAVLFRLSNRVKIWRRYRAELTSSSLLLHASEPPHLRPPKRCIPLGEIKIVRKPHNLSTSFTTILTAPAKTEYDGTSKYCLGSVPVARKFSTGPNESTSRTNYGHFELLLNSGKSHRLRGTNPEETDIWLRHIKRRIRAHRANEIAQQCSAQLVMQGWVRRVKGGEMTWVWCRLMGQYLVYSPGPGSSIPTGFKSLDGTQVRTMHSCSPRVTLPQTVTAQCSIADSTGMQVQLTTSSDSDTLANGDSEMQRRTIALWTDRTDPVYLICRTEEEYEQWKDHLHRACKKPIDITVDARMNPDLVGIRLREQWRFLVKVDHATDPYHTDRLIKVPISKTTETNQAELCTQMIMCLLALSYPQMVFGNYSESDSRVSSANIFGTSQWLEIKYTIVKFLSNLGLTTPELKDELFLQVIKQATLSETQERRLLRRQFPQRSRRTIRTLPWFCVGQRSPRGRTTSSGNVTLVGGHHAGSDLQGSPHSVLVTSREVPVNEFINRLSQDASLAFPVPTNLSSSRPEGWWPVVAVWEFLCLILPLFLPSTPVLYCLELLITIYCQKGSSTRTGHPDEGIYAELSRYAAFCKEALKQTIIHGGRYEVPSALEVASISIRNPYTHTYPFSLPIHVPNGNVYEVVSFNGGSEFRVVIEQMTLKLTLPSSKQQSACVFGIYLRLTGVGKPTRYIYLRPEWKMCDILSLYERAVISNREERNVKVPLEDATAEFVFRIQAFSWKKLKKLEIAEVKPVISLLTHQLHEDFLLGSYPVIPNGAEMLDMAALLCRANHFDYTELQNRREANLSQIIRSYFPIKWVEEIAKDGRSIIQLKLILLDRWSSISRTFGDFEKAYVNEMCISKGNDDQDKSYKTNEETLFCIAKIRACFAYLRLLRRLLPERFATTIFPANASNLPGRVETDLIWLVPQESQLNVLTVCPAAQPFNMYPRMCCTNSISYNSVLSFGGQRDGAFYLVYSEQTSTSGWRKSSKGQEFLYATGRMEHLPGAVSDNVASRTRYKNFQPSAVSAAVDHLKQGNVRKVRFYLTDLNAVMELSDTLAYFINLVS